MRKTQFKCLQTQPNKNDRLDVKLLHSHSAPPFSSLPFCCSKRSRAIASLLLLAFGNSQLILVAQGLVYFACTPWAMLCKNLPCLNNLALCASLEFTNPPWLRIRFAINLCVPPAVWTAQWFANPELTGCFRNYVKVVLQNKLMKGIQDGDLTGQYFALAIRLSPSWTLLVFYRDIQYTEIIINTIKWNNLNTWKKYQWS